MRRRRRSNGTWFPTIGTYPTEADPIAGISFSLGLSATSNDTTLTGVLPLTFDYPQEEDQLDPTVDTLSEIVGSEYVCKRIVGKLFALHETGSQVDARPAVLLAAGIFVARADDPNGPNGANSPIGLAGGIDEQYGVLRPNVIREPWMWRRSWILGGNPLAASGHAYWPPTTVGYGSVADGPHVDCRVKRVVSQDNRLWLALSARRWPLTTASDANPSTVSGYFDYRIFGSLRKAKNTSAF